MSKATNIKGFDQVLKNFNREVENIKGRTVIGLIDSAIIIRRSMDMTFPKIPVDTNNLRASWFTELHYDVSRGVDIGIVMGFSANYALWVHENVDADFVHPRRVSGGVRSGKAKYTKPREGAGPKFLEAHLKMNRDLILQTLADSAKIP